MNGDHPADSKPSRGEIALWRSMVARALRSGVPYEDAQDLASEAVRKALAAHEPERGPFGPFCRTIHGNLLRNYWRDRKPTQEFDPETDDRESGSNPLDEVAFEEGREMMRRIADQILATLDPREAAFFLTLADACQEAEKVAVTAAARRLGIDPMEGWNLFRRIQRKARRHAEKYEITMEMETMGSLPEAQALPEGPTTPMAPCGAEAAPVEEVRREPASEDAEAPAAASPPMLDRSAAPTASNWIILAAAGSATAGYERFAARLDEGERRRLAALLA
jgi:DNA-directed RNA polymerase specialized sigma24 family protein